MTSDTTWSGCFLSFVHVIATLYKQHKDNAPVKSTDKQPLLTAIVVWMKISMILDHCSHTCTYLFRGNKICTKNNVTEHVTVNGVFCPKYHLDGLLSEDPR